MTTPTPPPLPPQNAKSNRLILYVLLGLAGLFVAFIGGITLLYVMFSGPSNTPATQLAEREWDQTWIRRGSSWFTKATSYPLYAEIKDRTVQVTESSLSQSDRLNGIEWSGVVRFDASAHRVYASAPIHDLELNTGWSEWEDPGKVFRFGYDVRAEGHREPIAAYAIQKRAGQWIITERGRPLIYRWHRDECVKPQLSELPK